MAIWRPHPGPQELALRQPDSIYEILFGGSRGPGKTDAGLVWLTEYFNNPQFRGLVIRRNADDLSDWVDRASKMYSAFQVKIAYRPAILTFPSGAIVRTGHLKDDQAYTKYMGHEYQRILIEELTQIPTEKRYLQLLGSLRSTIPEIRPQAFLTTNPGGVGHGWVKSRFIDNHEPNRPFLDQETKLARIFIPATVDDNPTLVTNDPGYLRFLDGLKKTDEDLWKSWRLGDWDIFVGQAFRQFRQELHVIHPPETDFEFDLQDCKRFIAFDWGYASPGCAIWMAITPENQLGIRRVYCYRELYQNEKHPKEWAEQLKAINEVDPVKHIILPHDCFNKESGDSIAETFRKVAGLRINHGRTTDRGARLNRIALTHKALGLAGDNRPFLQIHPRCQNLIRTLPSLVYDESKVEDIDTEGEDHAWDAMSLGLLMEAPEFNTSGSLKNQGNPLVFKKSWQHNTQREIQAPNLFEALKGKIHRSRWQKDR